MTMTSSEYTSALGRVAAALTAAGPYVSATGAAATVARLRKAIHWSDPYLSRLTGLNEAADRVRSTRAVVVDRRAAIDTMEAMIARALGGAASPLSNVALAMGIRAMAAQSMGVWDPFTQHRVLIAPNVLAASEKYALDQKDYCRWSALRTGLWAVHLEHAPHLIEHMGKLAADLPARAVEFKQLIMLLVALPDVEMEALTPRDLPSIGWIRRHKMDSAGLAGLHLLHKAGVPSAHLEEEQAAAQAFARMVMDNDALPLLLETVENLPTVDEFSNPSLWRQRVGI